MLFNRTSSSPALSLLCFQCPGWRASYGGISHALVFFGAAKRMLPKSARSAGKQELREIACRVCCDEETSLVFRKKVPSSLCCCEEVALAIA